ncbi:MAG: bifunctional enoyl-CoA hydratase/phosphate acetyltransferase [Spirochaetaceae bacterium]|nr:MAG: bifunctional enoyl-CoA hydratase/phosphate acetyltransferase [Spirochaetaceae bacterium]
MIRTFEELEEAAKSKPSRHLALAMAEEADALKAVVTAAAQGVVEPILVGQERAIREIAEKQELDISSYRVVAAEGEEQCAARAVELVREGEAAVLMKGRTPTAVIMRAILHRHGGLRGPGVLSHVSIIQIDTYPKLLIMSDPGINIAPDLKTKAAIIGNTVYVAHRLGIEQPKVAVIAAVEKVNPVAMPVTVDAALLSKMSERGQIPGCIVDGPFALDSALSRKSCETKGIQTEVGGDADILLMPDIEAANVFYKTLAHLTDAKIAAMTIGAKAPVVMSSRADSDTIKYLSILGAVSIA